MKMHRERIEFKEDAHLERMEVLLGLKPWRKEFEFNQEETDACPEKLKGSVEEMEAVVVTFERSDKMEAADLEETSEATEAVVGRRDERGRCRVFGSTLGCTVQPTGEEADPRKCWGPTKIGSRPKTNEMPCCLRSVQGT
jgi:hypothetical protein